jgi:RNA polymerase sigma-70 factor (ECF subfamily)
MQPLSQTRNMFAERTTSNSDGPIVRRRTMIDILRHYRPHIFCFLLASFGDPKAAKALTRRWMETAFEKWSDDWDESHAQKALMRIAVNLERSHWWKVQLCLWRNVEVKRGLAYLNEWLPTLRLPAEDQIRARGQVRSVWSGVSQLGNRQKIVFLLHCVENMTIGEIAEVADIDEWRVKALLSEGLETIRMATNEG